jgi:glycosyltransferase involved in cell wall biosynthesis
LSSLKKNKIKYTNWTNLSDQEIVERYNDSDMVTFTSTFEGFGMPIIESNAVGRPVVTSNIAPMSDVAGSAACLVDPYSISDIKRGILAIINDSKYRDRLVIDGLDNVKRFSSEAISRQYLGVYEEITKKTLVSKLINSDVLILPIFLVFGKIRRFFNL